MHIIAVTGYGSEEDRRRTQDAGFDQHCIKPVEPQFIDSLLGRTAAGLR